MNTSPLDTATVSSRADAAPSFEDFVHATSARMMRTAYLITADQDAAADLLQTTYATAFSRWNKVSAADHPLAYVRKMMFRLHLDQRRKKRVVEVHREVEAVASADHTDDRLALLAALASLPVLDRTVVVLRHWEDLSVADTAAQLGISETACRLRCMRALKRLREEFPALNPQEV